jgi:hypothetical protein
LLTRRLSHDRLESHVDSEKKRAVAENEQHEQWLADYAALKRKRDAVADELREAYAAAPRIAAAVAAF